MQEGSIYGLFKTIVFIVGFYYVFKFLSRLFLPIIIKSVFNKVEKNIYNQHSQYKNSDNSAQNTANTSKNPQTNKKIGEYIDYEEIE